MDVVWGFLSTIKTGDGCTLKFPDLSRLAKLVSTLLHSNEGEVRVFGMIKLNKTLYHSTLGIDGTLSSILPVKLHTEPCYESEPSAQMLDKSNAFL